MGNKTAMSLRRSERNLTNTELTAVVLDDASAGTAKKFYERAFDQAKRRAAAEAAGDVCVEDDIYKDPVGLGLHDGSGWRGKY